MIKHSKGLYWGSLYKYSKSSDYVKKIVKLTPKNRQTLLFSATMPIAIRELAEMFLQDPAKVSVSPVSSTAENVEQRIYFVEKTEKRNFF